MNDLGPRLGEDYLDCLRHALEINTGTYALEFGVASGRTLRMIADKIPVTGFDSFEGLPEDWREGFSKGAFAQPPPNIVNTELVIGWFEDSLPIWLDSNESKIMDLGLVHIDCDLYSSTVTVLNELTNFFKPGTLIVFDEYHGYPGWESHEHKAWTEFCELYEMPYEVLGHGPEQLLVRMT